MNTFLTYAISGVDNQLSYNEVTLMREALMKGWLDLCLYVMRSLLVVRQAVIGVMRVRGVGVV